MNIKYEWRELTVDGLLKTPRSFGPYYDEMELLGGDTEEEAIKNFDEFIKKSESYADYVLVKIYNGDYLITG